MDIFYRNSNSGIVQPFSDRMRMRLQSRRVECPQRCKPEKILSEMPDQGAKIRWEYVFLLNTIGMAISNGKMSFQSFWILLPPSTPWLMLILGSVANTHVASWSSSSSVCKKDTLLLCFLTFFPFSNGRSGEFDHIFFSRLKPSKRCTFLHLCKYIFCIYMGHHNLKRHWFTCQVSWFLSCFCDPHSPGNKSRQKFQWFCQRGPGNLLWSSNYPRILSIMW